MCFTCASSSLAFVYAHIEVLTTLVLTGGRRYVAMTTDVDMLHTGIWTLLPIMQI